MKSLGPDEIPAEQVEQACEIMHAAYEEAAVGAGWETQTASRKPWRDVPEVNKATMRAAVRTLLHWLAVPEIPWPSAGATTTQTSDERALLETVASRNVCHETGDEIEMRCEYAPGLHRHAWPAAGASTEEPAPPDEQLRVYRPRARGAAAGAVPASMLAPFTVEIDDDPPSVVRGRE